uniref:Uncharacterized protein n=1 Tax=Panagrolaimus sp. ES5 TaxID=591445 RepID=A0AC34F8U5_9BILA
MHNKPKLLEDFQSSENALHLFTVFIIGIGIAFLFITLTRFMIGVMGCLDLIFSDAFKKASNKVEKAKKRGASKKGGSSSKKKKRSSKSSSKSSKSKSSKSSAIKSAAKKKKDDLKQRLPSTSPKPKTAKSNVDSSRTDSSKKDGTNSSSARKFKRWIVEKRKSDNTNKSSNSSTINATSFDLLATPKTPSQLPTALPPTITSAATTSTRNVTFDNVPEPASNTAYKYASVATAWPGAIPQDPVPKLFKSDDCPTPNPFKDPSLNSSPIATTPRNNRETVIVEIPKSGGDDSSKKSDDLASASKPLPLNEYIIYAPDEVPSQFATDNVKTALEFSSTSPGKKGLLLKKRPSQTIIPIPSSPLLSIQSTPRATSNTQNSLTLQSPVQKTFEEHSVQSTPQATSDTQNSATLGESPGQKT